MALSCSPSVLIRGKKSHMLPLPQSSVVFVLAVAVLLFSVSVEQWLQTGVPASRISTTRRPVANALSWLHPPGVDWGGGRHSVFQQSDGLMLVCEVWGGGIV